MARRKPHWSEVMTCPCGARFTKYTKEAYHRHNFPALCRPKRTRAAKAQVQPIQPHGADVTLTTMEK